ncbi:MAG: hypothetical protein J7L47_05785 [Candidatus Odinarchaeota archaeon]|nr:hypothetical protein [Candidatus Odinarchaeota archaeon]
MVHHIISKLLQDIYFLRTDEGYLRAGYPRYFSLFGRDSIISSLQLLDIDSTIAKATLLVLSKYQGKKIDYKSEEEPGKILHEYRFSKESQAELPNWKFPYYGSVDSTPLFIILAERYFEKTKDIQTIRKILKNLIAAYYWIIKFGDKDKDSFVEYKRLNPHGLFHQGWRDGSSNHLHITPPVAIVEVQGYTFAAYDALLKLLKKLKCYDDLIPELKVRMQTLEDRFNDEFWVDDIEYFALALDGKKQKNLSKSSNPGHLLFTGIINRKRAAQIVSRLFEDDMWTPYGIRTCSERNPNFNPVSYHHGTIWPHDNWFVFMGCQQLGFNWCAKKIMKSILEAFIELKKMPELYSYYNDVLIDLSVPNKFLNKPIANPIQAWSSGALLDMLTKMKHKVIRD